MLPLKKVSYETTVQCDSRFDDAVFIVQRDKDHQVRYAGNDFAKAVSFFFGCRFIVVWMDGTIMGWVNQEGKWLMKFEENI